jgi:ATP-dependent helicase/nuclease subunit B
MGAQGADALAGMKARGDEYLHLSALHDAPSSADKLPPAPRPAPSPPIILRPKSLSVTQIETLIRDPYAIYARFILKLRRLDPIGREPDQLERGSALHDVMHRFIDDTIKRPNLLTPKHLINTAETVLADLVPWPDMRRLWLAQLSRIAQQFVAAEKQRRLIATPLLLETKGATEVALQHGTCTLTGKADRIDLADDGGVLIYDYKSGAPPALIDISNYAKQLLLEAAMVERGGFSELGIRQVRELRYLTLSLSAKDRPVDLAESADVWAELTALLHHYESAETGYPARIRSKHLKYAGEFDHLSRRGEWEDGADYKVEML